MEFSDKLSFLMKLCETTNKQLGEVLGVDPSQISRLRSGKRGMPGNGEYLQRISQYFAERCVDGYRRSALAEVLMRPALMLPVESQVLAIILREWLMGTLPDREGKAEELLRGSAWLTLRTETGGPSREEGGGQEREMHVFFGDEGKRAAVRAFIGAVLRSGKPLTLDVSSDENLQWLVGDYAFAGEVQAAFRSLEAQGCVCRRIVGPLVTLDYSYASLLMRWLPSYISGHVTSYYYPRLRDDLYHRTLLIAAGTAAVFSASVGVGPKNRACFFTTDPAVVEALSAEFEDYLALCLPQMERRAAFPEEQEEEDALLSFSRIASSSLLRSSGLSAVTMTGDMFRRAHRIEPQRLRRLFARLDKQQASFLQQLEKQPCYDMMELASPEDVLAGRVELEFSASFASAPLSYTPEQYLQHLKNVLWLSQRYPNYHPIFKPNSWPGMESLWVKEGKRALMHRAVDPDVLYVVSERNLLAALAELLHRTLPADHDSPGVKAAAEAQLRELIAELEERIKSQD